MRSRAIGFVWLVLALVAGSPTGAEGQGVRGWVGTTVRYLELQPMGLETVPESDVTVGEDGLLYFEGQRLNCVSSVACERFRSFPKVGTVAATQDLRFTAWGFGMRGLSATVFLRNRLRQGGDLLWPRTDDTFDALLAYAQLSRGRLRVRAGRQEITSGLGFSAFDGVQAGINVGRRGHLEAYAGRSLARGTREPLNKALSGVEDFFPDRNAYLVGVAARGSIMKGTRWVARYQREQLSDHSGLVSERASVDLNTVIAPVRITASADYDFASARVGKSHLTLGYALPGARLLLQATGRRYVPYFELSTIWGFFNPVAYHEGEVRLSWSPASRLGIWALGGIRSYGDTETTVVLSPLEDQAWRTAGGLIAQMGQQWNFEATYRLEWGNGAFLNSGDLRARWGNEQLNFSGTLSSFQQIEEFRLGDGRVLGGGGSVGVKVMRRTWIDGSANVYFHRPVGEGSRTNWDQFRAWMSVRVELGGDPGGAL